MMPYAPPKPPKRPVLAAPAWSMSAMLAGAIGMALAFTPWGPVGAVAGGVGVATGVVGLLRARESDHNPLGPVIGVVVSALAIITTLANLLFAPASTTPVGQPDCSDISRYGESFNRI